MTTQEILQAAQGAKCAGAGRCRHEKRRAGGHGRALIAASDKILEANQRDLDAARGRVSDVMLDRLALTPSRLTDMAKGMREVAALPDPVGAVLRKIVRPNGLIIERLLCRWALSPLFTRAAPTSPATPLPWLSRRAAPAFALRPRRLGQLPRHRGGPARGLRKARCRVCGKPAVGLPRQRQRADDCRRPGRFADSRGGAG